MAVPLYRQLYNHVLDEIKTGRLQPGQRIPSEKELAEQFSVSRITSKKALESLMHAQVINRVRGKGSFVAESLPLLEPPSQDHDVPRAPIPSAPVALLLPDFSEVYGMRLLKAIEERLATHHVPLLLRRTAGRQSEEERAAAQYAQLGVAGLIVFPVHGEFYNAHLLRLVLDRFPLVLVDRYFKGIPACSVYTDNRRAAHQLTTYLLGLGHRDVAFVSPPPQDTSTIEDRLQGYAAAQVDSGLPFRQEYCLTDVLSTLPGSFTGDNIAADQQAIGAFLERNPQITAFVVSEYNIARILHRSLLGIGKRVPDDYALACFDLPDEPFGSPQFTHIRQDEHTMGQCAVDRLLMQVNGQHVPLQNVIDFELIPGASTMPL